MSDVRRVSESGLWTVPDVANYLRVDEETVIRLAGERDVPAVRIGDEWRFRREAIEAWLDDQMLGVRPGRLRSPDTPPPSALAFEFEQLFQPNHILPDMESTTAMGAIAELAEVALKLDLIRDKPWFVGELVLRETVLSSATGGGTAFPHTLKRHPEAVRRPFMLLARSRAGIDFHARDGKPVHLFVLLGLRYEELHLPWMAKLSRLLAEPGLFDALLMARSGDAMWKLLVDSFELDASASAAP
jgi:PTS system nitrogen regulatory IIA component